jgi:hypothetical protein
MDVRRRAVFRLQGLCYRWKLLEHPYGYDHVRRRYTLTGKRKPAADD